VNRLTGQTVHFDPWEATIAYAYPGFRWDPAPMFQSYNAYTAHLDDINASFLAGSRAPRYILRQNLAPDQRDPRFESPRYMLTMMCRYRQVMLVPGWQLLERGSNRCGTPVALGSRVVRFDQAFTPPAPGSDSILVGSFTDFSASVFNQLEQFFFRSAPVYIAANGAVYRFVRGHAGNPHVLSFPLCLGWSSAFFDLSPYQSLAIGHAQHLSSGAGSEPGTYRVSFERIPFSCQQ
jgi:hypothetical protein